MAMTRRGVVLVTALAVAVVVIGAVTIWRIVSGPGSSPFAADTCTVGGYDLDPGQASVAATMIGAVTKYPRTLPTRAQVLVLAAAMQESKLRNIPPGQGDRDSVGVLQQRPSQGWGGGSAEALTDVGRATTEFLDALVKVRGWQRMSVADAIQSVQISADGSLYAQHEPQARAMAAALSGRLGARTPTGITCEFDAPTEVAAARTVADQASSELGLDTPVASGSRTVQVPGAGWQTTAWFVANADRLGIDTVAFDGHRWTRAKGWTRASGGTSAVTATMADA